VTKGHTAKPTFALIGDKWYMVLHGVVVTVRPIEIAPARGIKPCVHCDTLCNSYCRSCRRAVCAGECWDEHETDHREWRVRQVGWTKVER